VLTREDIAAHIRRMPDGPERNLALDAFRRKYEGKPNPNRIDPQVQAARESFKSFIFQAWPIFRPGLGLKWNWHLDEFCSFLQWLYEEKEAGRSHRVVVNVPPGSAKSAIFSILFNAWAWAKDSSKQVLAASYTPDLAIRDNIQLRSLVQSDWFKSSFGVQLLSDQNAKEKFVTAKGGYRIGTSVGGFATGEHPNFLILIDDPLKALDARSQAKRKEANDWIGKTISTRVMHSPIIILVMQRLHEEDPSDFLLKKGGWLHLCLPMRFESHKTSEHDYRNIPDPRDHRTIEGELLWPEVWDEEKVQQEESLLDIGASGQLQQWPIPEGGLLYQLDWFEYVDSIDEPVECARGWDTAETDAMEKKAAVNNWTVGTKIGRGLKTGTFYVMDNVRRQLTNTDSLFLSVAKMDGKECKIREGSGSGKATTKARANLLAGYDYDVSPETKATGDKIQRNTPFRAQCKASNVKILRGPWNDAYMAVLSAFPLGKCDDDVDSSSNAFNALVGEVVEVKKPVLTVWGS
jgi:predicted phage terminase large subunit-like protein